MPSSTNAIISSSKISFFLSERSLNLWNASFNWLSETSYPSSLNFDLKAWRPECFPITKVDLFNPTDSGVIISYVPECLSIPSWWIPDSWANALAPTIALLGWTEKPVIADKSLDDLVITSVFIFVVNGNKSFLVLIAITTSSNEVLPALSPIPFIVHSICLAPSFTAAKELATARPKSLWQWTLNTALSILGTLFLNILIKEPNSSGIAYPTVSGIFIVEAPAFIAPSTHLHKKSWSVLEPSSGLHSTSSTLFLA